MKRFRWTYVPIALGMLVFVLALSAGAETAPLATPLPDAHVCANPKEPCVARSYTFEPHDLSFQLPDELAWQTAHNSEPFYAVLLGSAKAIHPDPSDPDDETECGGFFPETERVEVQQEFPDRKVFASRHGCSRVWYNGVNDQYNFLAVYAGKSLDEAREILSKVKRIGRFPGANIRKIQVVVDNGH